MTFNKKYLIFGIVLILSLGIGTFAYAQTTVNKDFNFSDTNYIYSLQGLSIGTSTTNNNSITFSDGTIFNQNNAAAAWTTDSTGIHYNSGNVGIGVTDPNSKLDVNGAIYGSIFYDKNNTSYYINPSASGLSAHFRGSMRTNGNINYYQNLASYDGGNDDTGTMKIDMPKLWSNTMMQIRIQGYQYSGNIGAWEVVIGGYNYSGNSSWVQESAEIRGDAPFNQVRMGEDGDSNVILLGDTNTGWDYPKIIISEFVAGHNNQSGWGSGWSVSTITDETGITITDTPSIETYLDTNGNFGIGTTNPTSKLDLEGQLDINSNKIINLAGPTSDSDAANKSYVDSTVQADTNTQCDDVTCSFVDLSNHEQGDYDTDGRLYWDLSAGIYIKSSNGTNPQTGGSLLWSSNNFTAGSGISVNYDGEDEPTLSVNNSPACNQDGTCQINTASISNTLQMPGGYELSRTYADNNNKLWWKITESNNHPDYIWQTTKNDTSETINQLYINGDLKRATFAGEIRSTIMRDQNNTSYYVNPSGTSNFGGTLQMSNNTISQINQLNFNSGERIYDGTNLRLSSNSGYLDFRPSDGSHGFIMRDFDGSSNSWSGIRTQDNGEMQLRADGASYSQLQLKDNGNVVIGGGSGKLDVGTVDPIYNIGDSKYATYMAGMTGVKEETTGSVTLTKENQDYTHTIDFQELEKGSDLWIFYQTSDFGENWNNLSVLLTGDMDAGHLTYKEVPSQDKLIIHGQGEGKVSYRLTAPRFDHEEWSNDYKGDSEGLTVPTVK